MKSGAPLSVRIVLAMLVVAWDVSLAAQGGMPFAGRLINSVSGAPIAGATVQIDELQRAATSGEDGSFTIPDVPPGTYHISVRLKGFSTRRTEVVVGPAASARVDLMVDPELHFNEVTTVTGDSRSQFDLFQPTTVLSGQDLGKTLGMSLGATLDNQAGVTARSFGPAPARPVIRGLDGDRVQILQDGQRTGDLSSQSGDHGVNVNPAAASRIEVVRGPATLIYGASAIGGLVNVITEDIPTRRTAGVSGNLTFDLGSAAREGGGAADLKAGNGSFAIHAGGAARRSGDVQTPEGALDNSHSRSALGRVGAAWTGERGYVGASYGYDDMKYGVPVLEEGQVQLTPRRHSIGVRAGAERLTGALDALRATMTMRRYRHDELEGDEVGTAFRNDTEEVEVMASHRRAGGLKGSFGGWFLNRGFGATGAEALSPDVDQRALAMFLYEEMALSHVTLQFGGRLEHTRYAPLAESGRRFTSASGSVGLRLTPAAANERLTVAVSVARAARNPALEELFYFGPHPGNFAFEVGNPALRPEHAIGIDASLRWRGARASGEVTFFRNDIQDFIFRSPLTVEQFSERLPEFGERFPGRDVDAADPEEFPIIHYVGADTVLQGIEAHGDLGVTSTLFAELGLDYVRGTLKSTGEPLPRMPPLRTQLGLRFQRDAFQVGGNAVITTAQDRLFVGETATDGYTLLKLYAAYSIQDGRRLHTVTARLDNVTDELYRNHLSLIKDLAPETGRNFKLLYNVTF